jgi:hypothetical protein
MKDYHIFRLLTETGAPKTSLNEILSIHLACHLWQRSMLSSLLHSDVHARYGQVIEKHRKSSP